MCEEYSTATPSLSIPAIPRFDGRVRVLRSEYTYEDVDEGEDGAGFFCNGAVGGGMLCLKLPRFSGGKLCPVSNHGSKDLLVPLMGGSTSSPVKTKGPLRPQRNLTGVAPGFCEAGSVGFESEGFPELF